MTLLSIAQNACNNLGVNVPTSIIGNTDPAATRLFQMARREGANLSTRANWTALITEHVFFADGSSDYMLPTDFRSMIDDTLWDRTRFWRMRGAMSPQQWQLYKSSIIGRATIERRWRIRVPSGAAAGEATSFSIDPAIGATDTSSQFVFEYVSLNWCRSGVNLSFYQLLPVTGQHGSAYAIGDRFEIIGGTPLATPSPYAPDSRAIGVVTSLDTGGTGIATAEVLYPGVYSVLPGFGALSLALTGAGAGATFAVNATTFPPIANGPAGQRDWAADTDTSLLDEDLIELGVIWRLARRLGLAYDEELSEYQSQVGQAVARDGGTAILNLAPYDNLTLVGPYNIQEGNFPGA